MLNCLILQNYRLHLNYFILLAKTLIIWPIFRAPLSATLPFLFLNWIYQANLSWCWGTLQGGEGKGLGSALGDTDLVLILHDKLPNHQLSSHHFDYIRDLSEQSFSNSLVCRLCFKHLNIARFTNWRAKEVLIDVRSVSPQLFRHVSNIKSEIICKVNEGV